MDRPHRLLSLALLAALCGCKETTHLYEEQGETEREDVVVARRTPTKEFYAADAEYLQKNSNFFFRIFDETFTRRYDDLPKVGEVAAEKRPMSGGYYPEQGGGTDVAMVGGKTPLQKYDDAFHGGQNKASAWEREKHTTGPVWAGHCNGYSAAAQRNPKEPFKSVTRGNITFAPQDVKALMAEIHMSADYEFLGGNRCALEGRVPTPADRADPTVMGDCEDINPGTFHAAITNWVGRMKHVLIMDEYSGDQVWNYPLYKYQVLSESTVTEAQAKGYVVGGTGEYIFNPSAVKFVLIRTKLTFAMAQKNESLGQLFPGDMELTYVLELNAGGEILGGEWVGESQQKHPDFLWVALEPMASNGTRYMGNPNLSNDEVLKIWAESAGFDPENPPQDIKRPVGSDAWGHWPSFDVVLDGSNTGAVFAGKKTKLRIKRREGLAAANVALDVGLNGAPMTSLSGAEGEDLVHVFEPGIGLNRLQLTFKKDGALVEEEFLRFHVVR